MSDERRGQSLWLAFCLTIMITGGLLVSWVVVIAGQPRFGAVAPGPILSRLQADYSVDPVSYVPLAPLDPAIIEEMARENPMAHRSSSTQLLASTPTSMGHPTTTWTPTPTPTGGLIRTPQPATPDVTPTATAIRMPTPTGSPLPTIQMPTATGLPLPTLFPPTATGLPLPTLPLPTATLPPLPTLPLPTATLPPLPTLLLPTVTLPPLPTLPLPTATLPSLP